MKRELTCIVCPMGCSLCVDIENSEVRSVEGNTCLRGEKYARTECTNPMRVITSTVRTSNGRIVPVKTKQAVPKERMSECMKEINRLAPSPEGLTVGSVICRNILNTGADVVVTAPLE